MIDCECSRFTNLVSPSLILKSEIRKGIVVKRILKSSVSGIPSIIIIISFIIASQIYRRTRAIVCRINPSTYSGLVAVSIYTVYRNTVRISTEGALIKLCILSPILGHCSIDSLALIGDIVIGDIPHLLGYRVRRTSHSCRNLY